MSERSALIAVARGVGDMVLEEYRVKANLHAAARPEISAVRRPIPKSLTLTAEYLDANGKKQSAKPYVKHF